MSFFVGFDPFFGLFCFSYLYVERLLYIKHKMQDYLQGWTVWIGRPFLSELQHKTLEEDLEHSRNNAEEY